jgi:hypothetical protein
MRHIIYLLLVANVVYLGWNLLQGGPVDERWSSLPPLPENVRPLFTLQEHAGGQSSSVDASGLNALTDAQPPGSVSMLTCQALGPFSLPAEVEAIAGRLRDTGLEPVQRAAESRVANGYWIYMPGMDKERSSEIVQQLDEKYDKDYFVGKDWVISLGTFKELERAEIRYAEVRGMGLDAILEQRFRTSEEYWLELPNSPAAGDVLGVITTENPGLQLHAVTCQ